MADVGSADFNATVTELIQGATYNWINDIDASFTLTSGYLVFFMQLGFALLTVGCVGAKSAKSVSLKNIIDASAGGVGYYLFGWAFAYGDTLQPDGSLTGNPFIGSNQFGLQGIDQYTGYYKWLFQYVFAISTATIVSGAVAERLTFRAYMFYAFFLTAWVYPVLTHWLWSTTGWASTTKATGSLLIGSGAYDTVGSGAVHMLGGVAGLAGAWVAGPRIGRFVNGKPVPMPGHNTVYYMSGVLMLWFGFYGFNPGTMGQIIALDGTSYSELVARCALSTSLGGSFGGVTGLLVHFIVHKIRTGHECWDLHAAGNGALTGMVVITSGCSTFEPWAAALGGILGGLIVLPSSWFVANILKVDDPVDAVTVHMTGGAAGVWWYSLMGEQQFVYELYGAMNPDGVTPRHYGWWRGDSPHVFAANTIWILIIFGWGMGMMVPFFYCLKLIGWLRVSPEDELAGADISHHGGPAYPAAFDYAANGYSDPSMKDLSLTNGTNGHDHHTDVKIEKLEMSMQHMAAELQALKKAANT